MCIGMGFGHRWYCSVVQINGIIWCTLFNYNGEDAKVPEIEEKIKPIRIYMMAKYVEYVIDILHQMYQIKDWKNSIKPVTLECNGRFQEWKMLPLFCNYCRTNTTAFGLLWLGLYMVWWYKGHTSTVTLFKPLWVHWCLRKCEGWKYLPDWACIIIYVVIGNMYRYTAYRIYCNWHIYKALFEGRGFTKNVIILWGCLVSVKCEVRLCASVNGSPVMIRYIRHRYLFSWNQWPCEWCGLGWNG